MKVGRPTPHVPQVDLGDEAPFVFSENGGSRPDRTSVSLRWLMGTVLTGVTSIALMGGALFAALEGRYDVFTPSGEEFQAPVVSSSAPASGGARKGDRLAAKEEEEAPGAKQVFRVSTVVRQGDRDLVKMRPFARLSADLVTSLDPRDDDIPPFNPLAAFSDRSVFPDHGPVPELSVGQVEGEVSLKTRDFPASPPPTEPALSFTETEIQADVREEARFLIAGGLGDAPHTPGDAGLTLALANPLDMANLPVRIQVENVSELAKTGADAGHGQPQESVTTVDADTSLSDLLTADGVGGDDLVAIRGAFQKFWKVSDVRAGSRLRIAMGEVPDDSGLARSRPIRVSVYEGMIHRGTIALSDSGLYVTAAQPSSEMPDAPAPEAAPRVAQSGPAPSLYESLYRTALDQDLPEPTIRELVTLFSYDTDFKAPVHSGDRLEVFYGLDDEGDETAHPEVLFAALTISGSERKFYRFRTPDDGAVDFYDDTGKSAQKFLMRKPMNGGELRSGFGARSHPILGYTKMHTGVDWAAPYGTPIMASGNGTVIDAGWQNNGYGRMVRIRHSNGYVTGYAHMSGIARNVTVGSTVTQGQIVGYVGSTGLSTGPHLHYEVSVNDRLVDPLRIKLPRGRELSGKMLAEFKKERSRVDALMATRETAGKPAQTASATN